MKSKDIMSSPVVAVGLDVPVQDVARLLVAKGISAAPVVDEAGKLAGIVSEGDLVRRPELGTQRRPSWWLRLIGGDDQQAQEYLRAHGRVARDVMSKDLVVVDEDTPVERIASLLEQHRIKRVPVVKDGRPIGIISRANLVQALAILSPQPASASADDRELRQRIIRNLDQAGLSTSQLDVVVHNGRAQIWGAVESGPQREAARLAVEEVLPAERVEFNAATVPRSVQSRGWA